MLSSKRPYLIKGLFQWLSDNSSRTFVTVNTLYKKLNIPEQFINKQGYVTLNLSESACNYIDLTSNEYILAEIRFNGVPTELQIDYNAIDAVFDPDNNDGFGFDSMEAPAVTEPEVATTKGFLKLVK